MLPRTMIEKRTLVTIKLTLAKSFRGEHNRAT